MWQWRTEDCVNSDTSERPAVDYKEEDVPMWQWSNIGLQQPDDEITQIYRMERRLGQLPQVAKSIRELILRLEICHFKFERHLQRIIESIGKMDIGFDPRSIGRFHPKEGENAWKGDKAGRSRPGQEYIWILQMWLHGDLQLSEQGRRGIPQRLFEEVYSALGNRDRRKEVLVLALLDRLLWKADHQRLCEEFGRIGDQIARTDICHYSFPKNVQRMIEAIGRLQPVSDFEGCGSFDEERRQCAQRYFTALSAWLEGKRSKMEVKLGERTALKEWLVACLAKTLKEHAGFEDRLLLISVDNESGNCS
jgi:hypothetical protein